MQWRSRPDYDPKARLFVRHELTIEGKTLAPGTEVPASITGRARRNMYRARTIIAEAELARYVADGYMTAPPGWKPLVGPPAAPGTPPPAPSGAPPPAPRKLRAVHRGGGRYVVVDEADQATHEGTLSRDEAERLAAGGGDPDAMELLG